MRPLVVVFAQFADQTAFRVPQSQTENIVPGFPHEFQQHARVPFRNRLLRVQTVLAQKFGGLGRGAILVCVRDLALNEGPEPVFQKFQRLADAFMVGDDHAQMLLPSSPDTQAVQSTTCNMGTRLNSRTLLVTSVTPIDTACAAMSRSIAPMGVPAVSRAARRSP